MALGLARCEALRGAGLSGNFLQPHQDKTVAGSQAFQELFLAHTLRIANDPQLGGMIDLCCSTPAPVMMLLLEDFTVAGVAIAAPSNCCAVSPCTPQQPERHLLAVT